MSGGVIDIDRRLIVAGFGVGVVCLVVAGLGGIADPQALFRAYLVGYSVWLDLALGCLGLALLQFLTGGAWGMLTRRIFEAGASTLPLLAVLFVPVLFGVLSLYPWSHADIVAADPVLQHKSLYLNVPFFAGRAVVYFVAWVLIARRLTVLSRLQDRQTPESVGAHARLQRLSIVGLLILPLTASFAAIDWWMSLEPEWFSTMYPPMVCAGDLLLAMAFAVLVVAGLSRRQPLVDTLTPQRANDLGSLLLAFLMLWAYMTFFQYLLIWAGNLKDEITWYVRRAEGGWIPVAWTLAGLGFLAPFWLMLFRGLKRSRRWLGAIAALVLVMQVVVVYWLIEPAFAPDGPLLDWRLPLSLVGVGGIWLATFARQLGAAPLLALNDPRAASVVEAAHAAA